MPVSDPNTRQVGGEHYKSAYQHWDFIAQTGLGYFPAQITRYVMRAWKKNGRQDMEKALHYAEKLRSLYNGELGAEPPGLKRIPAPELSSCLNAFLVANQMRTDQAAIFVVACSVHDYTEADILCFMLKSWLEENPPLPEPAR